MVSTTITTTTIAAGQPTSSSNHHTHQQQEQQQHRTATLGSTANANAVTVTANNSDYQRSASQQQQQSFHYPSSSSFYNSLAINGDCDDNYNSSNNNSRDRSAHSKNRFGSKAATLSGVGQESFIVADHNSTRYTTRPSTAQYNGCISITEDDNDAANQANNGDSPTKTKSDSIAEQTADVEAQQPHSHEIDTNSPTKATINTVNLSQSLLSNSPPQLNDQISLLFPKCRPRQLTLNDSNAHSATSNCPSFNTQTKNQTESSCESEILRLRADTEEREFERDESTTTTTNIKAIASTPTKTPPRQPTTTTTTNYYRSVNIITQSPPPPSTSSVSSESLSSVTPRISTNPFLNHNTDQVKENSHLRATRQHTYKYAKAAGDELASTLSSRRTRNDLRGSGRYRSDHIIDAVEDAYTHNREDEDALLANDSEYIVDEEDEELPVPSYPPAFYYHTETKHTQPQTRQRHHQPTGDNSNSYEMPRKRASYGAHHQQQPYTPHYASSAGPVQQQQQALQPLHKQVGNSANSASLLNQNPFIKDGNYWDPVRQVATSEASSGAYNADDNTEQTRSPPHKVASESNTSTAFTTQTSALSPTAVTATVASSTPLSSTRRSYHQQQPYASIGNGVPPRRNQPKDQQPQQHTIRLNRSANEHHTGEQQFAEGLSKRSSYHQKNQHQPQHQQQNSLQAVQSSCADGLTPVASQYLYGSKTSLDQQQQQHLSDNSILVERELKERDREQREQRKAIAAYSEWERERERERESERERDREWKLERERVRDRANENDLESEQDGEHIRAYERQQVPLSRRRDSYFDGSQQYQAIKNCNSLKLSKRDDRNGHSTVGNGEAMGFEDITESWQNLRVTTDTSAPTMPTTATRQHLQQHQQQQHHRPQPNTSLTLANDKDEEYIKQVVVNNHLDDVEVTGSRSNTNNNSTSSIMYKDHPKRYLDRSGYTMHAVETRHGIIEYEGSPRRIGGQTIGAVPAADDVVDDVQERAEEEIDAAVEDVDVNIALTVQPNTLYVRQTQSQELMTNSAAMTVASTNKGGSTSGDGGGSSQHTTTTAHNSPQQQYPARPGFPQRIISPPRENTPPIMLISHNTSKPLQHQQQQQQDYQQPLQALSTEPQRQPSPPTACTLDNNAEDTSNDVSEIGTISDLTTPEAISATTGAPTISIHTTDSLAANVTNATTTAPPTSASGIPCKPLTTLSSSAFSIPTKSSTFDYLYEFSETRKVLEEFFKCPSIDDRPIENGSDVDSIDIQYEFHSNLDRNEDDEMNSPCNVDAVDDDDDDDNDVEDDDDDDDDGLMGVNMDGIQPQQHHRQLQQQHNSQMRQLQTTLQQRNNQRETQFHTQTSPTPIPTTTQYRQQQQKQQHEAYLLQQQQHTLQQVQVQVQPQQQPQLAEEHQQQPNQRINNHLSIRPQRQQQQQQQQQQQPQLNNSSNNSINNSIIYNNSSHSAPHRRRFTASPLMRDFDFFLDSASRSSGEQLDQQDGVNHNQMETPSTYRYSPETTDYDSNCGDLDSLSGEINGVSTSCSNYTKYYASSMPVLEDGLSSGHTSDTENNNQNNLNSNLQQPSTAIHHNTIGSGGISMLMDMKRLSTNNSINSMNNLTVSTTDGGGGGGAEPRNNSLLSNIIHETNFMRRNGSPTGATGMHEDSGRDIERSASKRDGREHELLGQSPTNINCNNKVFKNIDPELDSLYSISIFHRPDMVQMTPPPPAPAPHRKPNIISTEMEILQPTPYKESMHTATAPSTTSPINALSTSAGTTTGSGVTSVASALSTTLNRNKMHTQHQAHSQSSIGNATSGLSNALRTNQPHSQTHATPAPPPTSSTLTSLPTSQTQSHSQPPPPPIPERNMPQPLTPSPVMNSPVWLPRHLDNSTSKSLLPSSPGHHSKNMSAEEDDVDTDLETDRLLGHQRLDDQGYYDENKSWESRKPRTSLLSKISPKQQMASTKTRNGYNALLSTTPEIPPPIPPKSSTNKLLDIGGSMSSPEHSDKSPLKSLDVQDCVATMGSPGGSDGSGCISGTSKKELDLTTITTNGFTQSSGKGGNNSGGSGTMGGGSGLVGAGNANGSLSVGGGSGNGVVGGHSNSTGSNSTSGEKKVKKSKNKEGGAVLIEGVLFRAKYLGSTQLVCEGQPTKSTRMMQAEEAVSRIKAPDGDVQPSTEVDLFISTEKIMVLNTDLKEIMMDHALRTISYIADIGDLVVLMARRRFVPQDIDDAPKPNRTPKMICHVFESDEAQFIAQSIGQAFQVAYMEFLKANGIEDHSFVKEMDYQEVLNSQEIFGDELEIFAKKELQKEVVVPKAKGEILGVVIVESGWGSMLPTVVIANLMSSGAAARCGQLNIGDQLIAINGLSLVGLPLSTCQTYIKNTKNQTVVKFTVVPCAPVVEVKIKRPNTKYQLGFSVQNGVICSLLRGGIAERGGVRVGHRIIEINNQSVVAVPHEKIVNLLATSVGEILMKTMPTSMFRLLTGQENPIYI